MLVLFASWPLEAAAVFAVTGSCLQSPSTQRELCPTSTAETGGPGGLLQQPRAEWGWGTSSLAFLSFMGKKVTGCGGVLGWEWGVFATV